LTELCRPPDFLQEPFQIVLMELKTEKERENVGERTEKRDAVAK
jgi:hypothetical protein